MNLVVARALTGTMHKRHDDDTDTLIASTLAANSGRNQIEQNYVTHALSAEGAYASEDGTGRGTPIVTVVRDERGRCTDGLTLSDESFPLHAAKGPSEQQIVAIVSRDAVPKTADGLVTDLRAGNPHPGGATLQGMAVRRLTPTECERLQGFPDGWTCLCDGVCKCADSPRYKTCGNAVTRNVAEWFGHGLMRVHGL